MMDRRQFLKGLGLAVTALIAAPALIFARDPNRPVVIGAYDSNAPCDVKCDGKNDARIIQQVIDGGYVIAMGGGTYILDRPIDFTNGADGSRVINARFLHIGG